ncbi:Neutral/alkaline nonlysosomal ceramidase [Obelidium mucronatum]|nr:Neutral/alkaline nonlysosomal ceramidase [Obelidium mucronatum]
MQRRRFSLPSNTRLPTQHTKKTILKSRESIHFTKCLFLALFIFLNLAIALFLMHPRFQFPKPERSSTTPIIHSGPKRVDFPMTDSPDAAIMVGTGKSDISLPIGEVNMMGYAEILQNANGIHLRLKARAFIFTNPESSKHRAVYVCADLGFMSSIARQQIAERLNTTEYHDPETNQPYYTIENVMVSVTHTHSGPGGFADGFMYQITSLGKVPMAREAVVDAIVSAIQYAHSDLESSLRKSEKNQEFHRVVVNTGILRNGGLNRSPSSYNQNPEQERAMYDSNVDQKMVGVSIWTRPTNRSSSRMKAHANWFPVHGTSLHSENPLVSGDNKGFASYLWELEENRKNPGLNFVAAFAQSNSGDVTPNLIPPRCKDTGEPCDGSKGGCNGDIRKCVGLGPGEDSGKSDFYAAEYIGRLQYEKAKQMTNSTISTRGVLSKGPILFRHAWVDMGDVAVELPDGTYGRTCSAAMGKAFIAGTTDGKGLMYSYQGYNKRDKNMVLGFIGELLNSRPASTELERCHHPKQILFNTGENHVPYPWQPSILPLQLFVLGRKLALVGQPSEITTMAGRRLRESVKKALLDDNVFDEDGEVVVVGLANAYSSYACTFEEYQMQRYEGGSTAFGPHTLSAYIKLFTQMAHSVKDPSRAVKPGEPAPAPENEISLVSPVLLDSARPGGSFGDAIQQPDKIIYSEVPKKFVGTPVVVDMGTLGDGNVSRRIKNVTTTVKASFQCAHPRNGPGKVSESTGVPTFMTVEKQSLKNLSDWSEFLTDADWDTKFLWTRSGVTESICKVEWDIGRTVPAEPGTYRFRIFGVAKTLFGEKKYSGKSLPFSLKGDLN